MKWIDASNSLCNLEDRNKNIWISFGKLNTLVRYNRASRRFTEVSASENPLLKITYCFSMAEDGAGNIWLGGDGLCRWNPERQAVDTLIPYPATVKALRNYMMILDRDSSDNLWLYSFDNGIIQYNRSDNRMYLRKEENSLTDGDILGNSPIIGGNIWLGMENGVAAFNIVDHSSRLFTYADGLPTVAITSNAKGFYYDAEEKVFYLGSKRHLMLFHPGPLPMLQQTPTLFIDAISTADRVLPGNTDTVELGYANSFAQVSFNAVNFINPEGNRFAYRVVPAADSSWHLLNWQRSVNFNNLAPGQYHIRIKLFSAGDRWPEQVKDLVLLVPPPYWRSQWFLIMICLVVALTVLGIYRRRVRQIRQKLSLDTQIAEYEMKALHAQMNPHFIFNSLNSIREMILQNDNRNASRYLTRFAQLIRLNLDHSKQTFITLQQNIDYLESYLEMEQLRFADFSYSLETAAAIDRNETRIAPMLIQPLVENAIWHGLRGKEGEKWVHIYFYLNAEELVCEIEDNGIGIRQSLNNKNHSQSMHQSMGIGNIRHRIAVLNEKYRIGCSLQIEDKRDIQGRADSGTLITLVLPAHENEFFIHKNQV
jgi:two-component sensor histidine kinase